MSKLFAAIYVSFFAGIAVALITAVKQTIKERGRK